MRLYKQRPGLFGSLQFNEMIAASERTELFNATFRLSFAAERRTPVIIYGHSMTFRAAAIKRCAILFDIVFRAAANQVIELFAVEILEANTLTTGTQPDPTHHGAIE